MAACVTADNAQAGIVRRRAGEVVGLAMSRLPGKCASLGACRSDVSLAERFVSQFKQRNNRHS